MNKGRVVNHAGLRKTDKTLRQPLKPLGVEPRMNAYLNPDPVVNNFLTTQITSKGGYHA